MTSTGREVASPGAETTECAPKPACKDRILDAAERVVDQVGLLRMTLDAVSAAAGVSKGGLLYHFPSKTQLVAALVERMTHRCDIAQRDALHRDVVPGGAFTRAYMAARTDCFDAAVTRLCAGLLIGLSGQRDCLEPFRQHSSGWQAQLRRDGIDPVKATIVGLAADGLCLSRMLGLPTPEGELCRQVMDELRRMTLPVAG